MCQALLHLVILCLVGLEAKSPSSGSMGGKYLQDDGDQGQDEALLWTDLCCVPGTVRCSSRCLLPDWLTMNECVNCCAPVLQLSARTVPLYQRHIPVHSKQNKPGCIRGLCSKLCLGLMLEFK